MYFDTIIHKLMWVNFGFNGLKCDTLFIIYTGPGLAARSLESQWATFSIFNDLRNKVVNII